MSYTLSCSVSLGSLGDALDVRARLLQPVGGAGAAASPAAASPAAAAAPTRRLCTSLLYSPCGGLLFAGCSDGSVSAWDADRLVLCWLAAAHEGPVLALDVSAAGFVVSAGADGTVRLWSAATAQCLCTLLTPSMPIALGVAPQGWARGGGGGAAGGGCNGGSAAGGGGGGSGGGGGTAGGGGFGGDTDGDATGDSSPPLPDLAIAILCADDAPLLWTPARGQALQTLDLGERPWREAPEMSEEGALEEEGPRSAGGGDGGGGGAGSSAGVLASSAAAGSATSSGSASLAGSCAASAALQNLRRRASGLLSGSGGGDPEPTALSASGSDRGSTLAWDSSSSPSSPSATLYIGTVRGRCLVYALLPAPLPTPPRLALTRVLVLPTAASVRKLALLRLEPEAPPAAASSSAPAPPPPPPPPPLLLVALHDRGSMLILDPAAPAVLALDAAGAPCVFAPPPPPAAGAPRAQQPPPPQPAALHRLPRLEHGATAAALAAVLATVPPPEYVPTLQSLSGEAFSGAIAAGGQLIAAAERTTGAHTSAARSRVRILLWSREPLVDAVAAGGAIEGSEVSGHLARLAAAQAAPAPPPPPASALAAASSRHRALAQRLAYRALPRTTLSLSSPAGETDGAMAVAVHPRRHLLAVATRTGALHLLRRLNPVSWGVYVPALTPTPEMMSNRPYVFDPLRDLGAGEPPHVASAGAGQAPSAPSEEDADIDIGRAQGPPAFSAALRAGDGIPVGMWEPVTVPAPQEQDGESLAFTTSAAQLLQPGQSLDNEDSAELHNNEPTSAAGYVAALMFHGVEQVLSVTKRDIPYLWSVAGHTSGIEKVRVRSAAAQGAPKSGPLESDAREAEDDDSSSEAPIPAPVRTRKVRFDAAQPRKAGSLARKRSKTVVVDE